MGTKQIKDQDNEYYDDRGWFTDTLAQTAYYLEYKDLCRASQVCKTWENIFNHKNYWNIRIKKDFDTLYTMKKIKKFNRQWNSKEFYQFLHKDYHLWLTKPKKEDLIPWRETVWNHINRIDNNNNVDDNGNDQNNDAEVLVDNEEPVEAVDEEENEVEVGAEDGEAGGESGMESEADAEVEADVEVEAEGEVEEAPGADINEEADNPQDQQHHQQLIIRRRYVRKTYFTKSHLKSLVAGFFYGPLMSYIVKGMDLPWFTKFSTVLTATVMSGFNHYRNYGRYYDPDGIEPWETKHKLFSVALSVWPGLLFSMMQLPDRHIHYWPTIWWFGVLVQGYYWGLKRGVRTIMIDRNQFI
eukprot:TRINITY_DN8699_c0_g1_i1.p1 TRINITY_DN8699_c0_g1~~TRINITY_DN8699_c0_g1_i1.p1  ORF type:complete len:355 (-),score=49.28 TRINITY_DN8699_c0_g1_i1:191-1255(-)